MSECIYFTLIPFSCMYSDKSSDIRLVKVVTKTLYFISMIFLHSEIRSSTCVFAGRISISGSISPVGLIICSVNTP